MKLQQKILVDLERLRYPHSGIATVFRNLANGLQEIDTPLQIAYFGKNIPISSEKNHTVEWKKWHKFYENFSTGYSIIHVSHQLSSYFHQKYRNSLKIVTLHDLNFLHEDLPEKKRRKILGKVNQNLKNCDYLVCISEFAKQDFLKNAHLFSFKNLQNITVIHNGIVLPENRNYNLGRFSDLESRKYILNIGVLFHKKNQLALVEMLPYISEDLVLVYSDEKQPYADLLRQRVKDLNLENRVHFLFRVSEEEKYALIQHSTALCHPSTAEGFGIPPIEAMAFGKPVFLSNFTSLPEIGGALAFYFDEFEPEKMADVFQQKMKIYYENPVEYSVKIKNWTKQFNYIVMSRNYLNLYGKLAKKLTS